MMEGNPWKVLRDTGSQTVAAELEVLSCIDRLWWVSQGRVPDLQYVSVLGPR